MTDVFIETLHSWQTFYFTMGGAAAALLGLMFVALSLGMHIVTDVSNDNIQAFVTPSIFYFVSAFLLACVMLVPAYTPSGLAITLFLGGAVGLGRTIPHVRKLIRAALQHQDFTRGDWLSQVIMPVLSYTLILAAAICFAINQWSLAFIMLWVAVILILICAIANTWSLVMWIIEQRMPPSEE